jgi:hypothetical protein
MAEAMAPFIWGSGGERLTPEQIERKRKVAEALAKHGTDASPVQHWAQGAARVAQAMLGGWEERKASEAEKANSAESASLLSGLLAGAGGSPSAAPAAASVASGSAADPAAAVAKAPADLLPRFAQAEAQYGLPKNFMAQTAKIESNFNPNAKNPNSSAEGLFQFVKGTAKQYGLTNPRDPIASTDAAARLAADNKATLMRSLGREPTAGELYLAHQQGGGGASKLLSNPNARAVDIVGPDAVRLNGGNPNMTAAEFARLWTSKVAANEADMPAPGAMQAEAPIGQPGFAIPQGQSAVESIPGDDPAKLRAEAQMYAQTNPEAARQMLARADAAEASMAPPPMPPARPVDLAMAPPAAPAMTAQTFNAVQGGQPLEPVFQSEGAAQPWMGTAIPPQAPMVAQAPAQMPPPRPADLPAPGAVEAIGQMPPQAAPQPQMMPDLSNSPDGGMRQLQVQAEQARQSQPAAPQEPMNPLARVAAAFTSGGAQAAPAAAPSPAVAAVAQAVQQNPGDPLVKALTSPYADATTKKIAMAMLLKKIEGNNKAPMAVGKDQRLVDPRTGRVILDRERNASDVKRSLAPVYGTDAEGNTVLLQPGDDGSAVQTKLPPGVKISAGVDKIDAGTEWLLYDKKTGQMVGRQAKDIAGAESAKVEGKAAGEAKVDLPRVIANAEQMLGTIEGVRNHPGRNSWGAQGKTAGLPIIGEGIPGTEGRDFVRRVDQIKGKSFLEAFNSLKGGGQITETEGQKATDAIARLDRAQSQKGFDEALADLEAVVRGGMERAKAGVGGAPAQPQAAPRPTGQTKSGVKWSVE